MKIRSSTLGFTLTELILVIVLLSILSLFAASRFIGKSSFSAFALQEQVISVIRQIQVNRMQSNIDIPNKLYPERCFPSSYKSEEDEDDSYTNFCLSVASSCIGSSMACDLQQKCKDDENEIACNELAARSDFVVIESGTFSIDDLTVISPIEFDLLGNPIKSASKNFEILIQDSQGASSCKVNVNPQGYVSKGSCL
ncbi:Tfp pilus assembly protein FimT/FimU [Vibrio natriegens]|uniref:pilus assembly FimT family protein n=1 Tax=Vibrio natriegens TaxID=691 RepID=UPI0035591CFD